MINHQSSQHIPMSHEAKDQGSGGHRAEAFRPCSDLASPRGRNSWWLHGGYKTWGFLWWIFMVTLTMTVMMVNITWYGYGSIPINTIFSGMNIHLPAILMFTRGTRFWLIPICPQYLLIEKFNQRRAAFAKAWHVTHRRRGDRSCASVLPSEMMTR